jgi:putative flippase GtrA
VLAQILTLMPELAPPTRYALLRRFVRYGSVSAISTVTSLVILGLLVGPIGFPAIWANVIATAIATVPSFALNRRWVWAQRGRESVLRQATPYFLLSFAGLILSTIAVHVASDATINSSRLMHTAAIELANIGTYGALWIVQFVLCDRILFAPANGSDSRLAAEGPPFPIGGDREAEEGSTLASLREGVPT